MDKLVSFETAILAKEKGFNEVCLDNYGLDGNLYVRQPIELSPNNSMWNHVISAPTQSELQKWLREKHNIHIAIIYDWHLFNVNIMSIEYNILLKSSITSKIATYEDALERGLLQGLKLIK